MTKRSSIFARFGGDQRVRQRRRVARAGFIGRRLLGALALAWAPGAAALPVLSEVYYDAPGSDDGELFVEIAGLPGTSLAGYVLEGVNGSNGAVGPSIALEGGIGASGLFVIADRRADGSTSVAMPDALANFDFQNGPDSVVLRRADEIVDALGYGDFGPDDVFAGEGRPAPDAPGGASLARAFATLDTDDNAVDFAVLESPTPGVASFPVVPEPGTALLFGLGLAGLSVPGRRAPRARSRLRP